MKKILVIGGTRFVGRNLIETLIKEEAYDLTLFNRGITNPDLFPNIKKIKGDRTLREDLTQICHQDWDCVIDVSGYFPMALEEQFSLQTGKIGRYVYISTCSLYQFDAENPHLIKETEPIVSCTAEQKESSDKALYNEHKAECERILAAQDDLDYVILRPGLIIGQYDYTDRLYYWFYRAAHHHKILIGDEGKNKLSYTNVKDLVKSIVFFIENENRFKIYNVVSFTASIADFFGLIQKEMDKTFQLVSASADFLRKHHVHQWVSLPLWLETDLMTIDNSRVLNETGLMFNSIKETTQDLIHYYDKGKNWETPNTMPPSLSFEDEEKLIQLLNKY